MASIAPFAQSPFVCRTCSQALRSAESARRTLRTLATSRATYASYTPIASKSWFFHQPKYEFRQRQQPLTVREWSARTSAKVTPRSHRWFATQASIGSSNTQTGRIVTLTQRRLLSLSGPDASKFLQGLVTSNVDPARDQPYYSAFLDARGRVLWDVFIWPGMEGGERTYCIEVDGEEVGTLLRHLKKHKLRSKIVLRIVDPGELEVLAAWGHEMLSELSGENTTLMEDPRALDFGYRILHNKKQSGSALPIRHLADEQEYRLRRYQFGIPEGQKEIIRESSLPLEFNIDLSHGIHFGKGCYVGQELTIRTKHTGVVRKRVLPVQLYRAGDPIPTEQAPIPVDPNWSGQASVSADIKQLDENGDVKKGRAAGKLISSVGNVGLAMCRLEMMTPMRVSAEGGSFKPGMEFAVQVSEGDAQEGSESVLRVKPVVPSWLKEREEELWGKARKKNLAFE